MGSGKTSILSHQAATLSATTQSILRPAGSSNSLVHPADNIDFKRPAQALPHPDAPLAPNLSSSAPSCSAQTPETRRGGYGLHSPESGPLINANVSLNEEEDDPCIKLFPGFYNIDADGDVEVHVLSEPGFVTHRFRVSKAILGFHSTVFSGLVNFIQSVNAFPNSETASMSQTLQKLEPIPLHVEDDPTGLYAVLLILHHQYRQLPKVPTLNTMVEIAKVCEKYMVQWAVLPTATLWRTRIDEDTLRSSSPWLYLAWTFGWEREFEWITNDIIPRLEPPKEKGDGLLRTDDGRRLESYLPEVLVG